MKHLKKLEWLPDALSDGSIVTPDGPFTIEPERAIQFADYRFNKQQSMMPYNTVIALDRGENCSDRNDGNTSFTKTFLSKIGTAPVLIRSELLPPNTPTGDTEFDKTYPFWCLAITIVSSEMDLTNTYLCLEACNTGHNHQSHTWGYDGRQFYGFPLEAKKYLSGGIVKYKAIPDSKSFSFITTKISEKRSNIKLSVEGITQIKNPKVGKTYYLYIALPYNYLRYKQYLYDKLQIEDEDWNTYIKFRPCIKYKRENIRDLNLYTLPLSFPYELNCRYPEIFYSAWSTNTTTLPPPVIGVYYDIIPATYIGKTITFGYSIEWPIEDVQIEFSSSESWLTYTHDPVNKEITLTIASTTSTTSRIAYFSLHYPGANSRRIEVTQTGIPVINLNGSSVTANSLGGVYTISYNVTNPQENVTISTAETYDWITVGGDDSHISITVDRNSSTSGRTGYIYVTYTGAPQKTITVSQEARPFISTNNSSLTFFYHQSSASLEVSYDIVNSIDGEVVTCSKSNSNWFTVNNNTSTKKITVTLLSSNSLSIVRTGHIYLDYENAERVIIDITQTAKPERPTFTTTPPPDYYTYTVYATLTGLSGSITSTSISVQNASTGEFGKTKNTGGSTSTSITSEVTFNSNVSQMTISATAIANGKHYTGSTTVSVSTYIVSVSIPMTAFSGGIGGVVTDKITVGPRSVPDPSGDSNSLEDILADYETDQI